jgi:hypothetical protein
MAATARGGGGDRDDVRKKKKIERNLRKKPYTILYENVCS